MQVQKQMQNLFSQSLALQPAFSEHYFSVVVVVVTKTV
jgi:hypothetical protein